MGKMEIDGFDGVSSLFQSMGKQSEKIIKMSMYEGAGVIADIYRAEISALPTQPMRYLRNGDVFNSFTETNKQDLLNGVGIMKYRKEGGKYVTIIGIDGYGRPKTNKYPNGLPNLLVARSINSGSSVRRKNRFAARARNKSQAAAVAATQAKAIELIKEMEE